MPYFITHGLSGTKEYKTWERLRSRCNNPNNPSYKNYGGRGICVCVRWDKFENFYKDMGLMPKGLNTIDRINTNGNYTPYNCRWASWSDQSRNKRTSLMVTFRGETKCLKDWTDKLNLRYDPIIQRLLKSKWSVEKALTTPIRNRRS